jgi:Uma2 family endonuclease
MLAPTQHRFNVKEYYRMAETGVLRPDARVELLNGEIIDMSPVGPFHSSVTNYLIEIFTAASKGRWMTSAQNPVRLDDYSEPQLDLVLLKPSPDFYRKRHPQPEDVYLLVEVSERSLATDREEKLPAYGRAGIAEVWIVNLTDQTIEVYHEPHFNGYGAKTLLRSGDQARSQAFSDVGVNVSELLKR